MNVEAKVRSAASAGRDLLDAAVLAERQQDLDKALFCAQQAIAALNASDETAEVLALRSDAREVKLRVMAAQRKNGHAEVKPADLQPVPEVVPDAEAPALRACTHCGKEKPATREFFMGAHFGRGGLSNRCLDCLRPGRGKKAEAPAGVFQECRACHKELPLGEFREGRHVCKDCEYQRDLARKGKATKEQPAAAAKPAAVEAPKVRAEPPAAALPTASPAMLTWALRAVRHAEHDDDREQAGQVARLVGELLAVQGTGPAALMDAAIAAMA